MAKKLPIKNCPFGGGLAVAPSEKERDSGNGEQLLEHRLFFAHGKD